MRDFACSAIGVNGVLETKTPVCLCGRAHGVQRPINDTALERACFGTLEAASHGVVIGPVLCPADYDVAQPQRAIFYEAGDARVDRQRGFQGRSADRGH